VGPSEHNYLPRSRFVLKLVRHATPPRHTQFVENGCQSVKVTLDIVTIFRRV